MRYFRNATGTDKESHIGASTSLRTAEHSTARNLHHPWCFIDEVGRHAVVFSFVSFNNHVYGSYPGWRASRRKEVRCIVPVKYTEVPSEAVDIRGRGERERTKHMRST